MPKGSLDLSYPCSNTRPASPKPSLTSLPKTPHSSAFAVVTSSRSWSAWTPTGGEEGWAGASASSHGAMSSPCTCDHSR